MLQTVFGKVVGIISVSDETFLCLSTFLKLSCLSLSLVATSKLSVSIPFTALLNLAFQLEKLCLFLHPRVGFKMSYLTHCGLWPSFLGREKERGIQAPERCGKMNHPV